MAAVFSDEEIAAVKTRYPGLVRAGPDVVQGTLRMEAVYNGETLSGDFQIRITATNPNSDVLPALYETGGRTAAIAAAHGITDLRTLHRNRDGTACVCVKQIERRKYPPGSDLLVFVENLAVPYLYWLTYYERYGEGPWKDYAHGGLGLLEFYSEDTEPQTTEGIREILPTLRRELNWQEYHKQLRKPSGDRACLCGSGKPFRTCHKKAWQGVERLHREFLRLGINPRSLFEGIKK